MNFRRVWRTDQQAADRIKAGASSHPHLTLAWDEPEQRSQAAIALPRGHKSSHQRADQLTVALGVKQPRAPMADPTREWVRPAMPRLPSCVCIAATLHAIMPAPHSATDESQGAGQDISGGVIRSGGRSRGLRSPPVSSVRRAGTGVDAVLARICAAVIIAEVDGVIVTG
jgi:hypothetical protein